MLNQTKQQQNKQTHEQHTTVKAQGLTESCPGINCGASWSIPGLEGDRTFKDGLSIFCDSKELEPAMKTNKDIQLFKPQEKNVRCHTEGTKSHKDRDKMCRQGSGNKMCELFEEWKDK